MNNLKNLLFFIILITLISKVTILLLPFPELDDFKNSAYSPCIFDRKGNLLYVIPLPGGQRREYIRFDKIHQDIINIFIQSEDKRFFYHHGIDLAAIIRSLYLNMRSRNIVTGASTITMQLSRIITPRKKGITGKLMEAINAIRLEAKLGKEEILELWFNSIPLGMNTTGIASASRAYFCKDVKSITGLEACILAVVLRNPSLYNPFDKPEKVFDAVKTLALRTGAGTETGLEKEIESVILKLLKLSPFKWPFHAPHFTLYVKNNLSAYELRSGQQITTSLDLNLNHLVEEKIRDALDRYQHNRLTNGAALVLNNRTGEILVYIGSNDFNDKEHAGEIDGLHIRNQPGSCLKPFLYAYALESGFFPNTLIPDIPTDFGTDAVYSPMNFNNRFHGPVRLRVALASSLNVPAVYMITRLGVDNFRQKLVELGFESLRNKEHNYGSGLALGNAEVSLFELTRAFSIFPGKGKKVTPVWKYGENSGFMEGERVFSSYASAMICHILSDNASRALGFTTDSVLDTDFPAMFKTGTSNQFGNIWALGATTNFTVGVWMGNFSGNTVIGKTGSSIPAHIVKDILSIIDRKPDPFPPPEDAKKVTICPLSGGLATDVCPGTVEEYLPHHIQVKPCDFHYRENGMIKIKYPPLYTSWAREQLGNDVISLSYDPDETPFIRQPADNESFYIDPSIPSSQQAVRFEIVHTVMNDTLSIFVNGKRVDDITYPYTWFFTLEKGEWQITVKDHDSSDTVRIYVK